MGRIASVTFLLLAVFGSPAMAQAPGSQAPASPWSAILADLRTAPVFTATNGPLFNSASNQISTSRQCNTAAYQLVMGGAGQRVSEVRFANQPYPLGGGGANTTVYAIVAEPTNVLPAGQKRPGIVLVHGGGGRAFCDWARVWASHGFVVIAPNLQGRDQNINLNEITTPTVERNFSGGAVGGPILDETTSFGAIRTNDDRNVWMYHSVANVLRARSYLASRPDVDPTKIAVQGVSYGAFTTLLAVSIEPYDANNQRGFAAAAIGYGAGFQHEGGYWREAVHALRAYRTNANTSETYGDRWVTRFDPSSYVAAARTPILMTNWLNEPYYSMDIQQRTADLYGSAQSAALVTRSSIDRLNHGVDVIVKRKEPYEFIKTKLAVSAGSFPTIGRITLSGNNAQATVTGAANNLKFWYTTDVNRPWSERQWIAINASLTSSGKLEVTLPLAAFGDAAFLFSAESPAGWLVSSPMMVIGQSRHVIDFTGPFVLGPGTRWMPADGGDDVAIGYGGVKGKLDVFWDASREEESVGGVTYLPLRDQFDNSRPINFWPEWTSSADYYAPNPIIGSGLGQSRYESFVAYGAVNGEKDFADVWLKPAPGKTVRLESFTLRSYRGEILSDVKVHLWEGNTRVCTLTLNLLSTARIITNANNPPDCVWPGAADTNNGVFISFQGRDGMIGIDDIAVTVHDAPQ